VGSRCGAWYGGRGGVGISGNGDASGRAAKPGAGLVALENGFATVDGPAAVQAICDGLSEDPIEALLRKGLARLPHPYPAADRAAGYRYQASILQVELSLTQMLDAPVARRSFFEQ